MDNSQGQTGHHNHNNPLRLVERHFIQRMSHEGKTYPKENAHVVICWVNVSIQCIIVHPAIFALC